jgi:tetratricopeptide (TPR) repeat protein
MGVVYKARQKGLKRLVALKMIRSGAHAGPEELARFRREAEAVARLKHPHIVQVYDIREQDGCPCFALELVEGPSLQQKLAGTPQPARPAAEMVETLARAVHHAHERGIIHRDLKPSNVLLTADGVPKVTDFGLAKLQGADAVDTPTDAILGTPSYMAPEQAGGRAREAGPAADVYALGAILYDLLTGRPPFQGPTVVETLLQVRTQDPVPPRRFQPRVPRELETICLKCLQKAARQRYATALELAEDLARFRAGEPIRARRTPVWRRALLWARRRPAVAALVVLVTGLAVSLGLAAAWHAAEEHTRLAALREEALQLHAAGRAALERRDWRGAWGQFSEALHKVGAEPALADLRLALEQLRDRAGGRLARQEADAHYHDFVGLSDAALYPGMNSLAQGALLPGSDPAADLRTAEESSRKALALIGIRPGDSSASRLDPAFTGARREDVRARAYALLLVLADTVAGRPGPGKAPRERYREALRILDGVDRLGPPTAAVHLRRAYYRERLGEKDAAARERRRAAALGPATALDYFLLGHERLKQNDPAGALRRFEQALARQPDQFWAQCCLAVCCLRLGQWDRARDGLTVCLGRQPDLVWLYLLRGFAHRERGDLRAAEADCTAAAAVLRRLPNDEARYVLLVNRAVLRFRQGRLAAAADDLRTAAGLRPGRYEAHLNLARVYRKLNRLAKAEAAFAKALGIRPPAVVLADYHAERGRDLYRAGKYAESVAACEAALARDGRCTFARGLLAQGLLKLGRYREAQEAFDAYLRDGGLPVADVYRGRGLARFRLGDCLGAVADYTEALRLGPGAEICAHRGWAYFFADAWKPAEADFDRALRLDPEYGDAYNGRGLARVMLGRYREAVGDAAEALRRNPDTAEMLLNVACTFAQAAARAEADADRADRADRAALAAGYRTEAVQALRRAMAKVRAGQEPEFWRTKVLTDAALHPIRGLPAFRRMTEEYSRPQPAGEGSRLRPSGRAR